MEVAMTEHGTQGSELVGRIELIEKMIADGRRTTWRWGWAFVLWGAGHLAALGWTALAPDQQNLAWGVTMMGCGVATAVLATVLRRGQPRTQPARGVAAIWNAFVVSLFVLIALAPGAGLSREALVALILLLLGGANVASGLMLDLRLQLAVGAGWFVTSLVVARAPTAAGQAAFAAAALLFEVAFGLWLMAQERAGGARA
ncbi:MAG: hypothetical protein QM704_05645 [Anaeromyxobacteraceae bacterium]